MRRRRGSSHRAPDASVHGSSGVISGSSLNWWNGGGEGRVHSSVVAHFHYVLSLGAIFSIFAGFYYWFEKITGLKYNELLANLHFWIFFVGTNIIFFPQHFLGLQGMPRRIVDYPDAFAFWNKVSSIGYAITLVGVGVFLVMLLEAMIRRRPAEANPWGEGATTLEWTLPSPPPFHQFNELPVVKPDIH